MADPTTHAIAAALAGEAADVLVEREKVALSVLARLVRDRLASPAGTVPAGGGHDSRRHVGTSARFLAEALQAEIEADPVFGRTVRQLWSLIDIAINEGTVTNQVSGVVTGPVIQARDAHLQGGVRYELPRDTDHRE